MVTISHCLLRCNNTTKEDNNTLASSSFLQHHHIRRWRHIIVIFFSNTKKTKHTRKQHKKTKKKEGAYLQTPSLPSHLWFLLLPFCFKRFLLGIFFFSSRRKKKKNIEKKKSAEKGGSLPFFSRFCIWDERSSCFFLSTFLQRWALHQVLQALCLTSP